MTECGKNDVKVKKPKKNFNVRHLRLSLRYRPEIFKLILKLRQCIKKKSRLIVKLKCQLRQHKVVPSTESDTNSQQKQEKDPSITQINDKSTKDTSINESKETANEVAGWNINDSKEEKSIAEQVAEVAQSAMQQSGMVYVESVGMYYDYKTGYYYNSELGLYYHNDTRCYYYYSDEKQTFVFHSYPDTSAVTKNTSFDKYMKRKAKLNKKEEDGVTKPKRKKKSIKKTKSSAEGIKDKNKETVKTENTEKGKIENHTNIEQDEAQNESEAVEEKKEEKGDNDEMEDGECSETESEKSDYEDEVQVLEGSTESDSDDGAVAKHHPPCMRVIVKETDLPKLKIGSLFLVTKDGGTIGREGDTHTILIRDQNVSRNHLDIRYDLARRAYMITDLGSKNGTILNGSRISESQVVSKPTEVIHGSTLQLGETKLLCHIHPGNDTCGHCEPGLIMDTEEKEKKVAYTRTCSVQKQHQLELARLKNKYAPQPLMIEEKVYNDRAQARREAVGSSHSSEKTERSDLETSIAPENKGFKLLQKMGWSKGEGLGKDSQGDVEPIPLVSNEGKSGLGTAGAAVQPPLVPIKFQRNTLGPATLKLATRSKMLQPPAKAFLNPLDDDDEEQ